MPQYLMGIDNGLTVSKAAIFDLSGHEVAVEGCKVDLIYPRPAWVERDAEAVWRSTAQAILGALAKANIAPRDIVGIGNSGHGNGLYLLDRTGAPLGNAITSMDCRATDIIEEWGRSVEGRPAVLERNFPLVMITTYAAQPPALLAWFKRHRPELYTQIGHAVMCKDYIKYRLTGELTAEYSDISGSSILDSRAHAYTDELLDLYGIRDIRPALPQPVESHAVIGRVTRAAAAETGLAEGTPVVGGMFDINAAAVGSGVIAEGMMCLIAGTWSINEVVSRTPIVDARLNMCTLFAIPGLWLLSECSPTSATNLEWFVSNFCGEEKAAAQARGVSVYEATNDLVGSLPPGGTDVIFHPFLFGSNVQATARAGFYGLGAWHTKAHVLRALYEGVVFSHLDHVNRLRAVGAAVDAARMTGGGARSIVWAQMFADALQLPIEVVGGSEIAARGAALGAGVGVGAFATYQEAVQQAVQVVRRHEPDAAATPHYLARYDEYQSIAQAMRAPWDRLAKLSM